MHAMTYAKYLSRLALLLTLAYMLIAGFIFWQHKPTLGRSRFGGIEIQQANQITRISAHDLNCVRADLDFVCNTVLEGKRVMLTATHIDPINQRQYTCAITVGGQTNTCTLSLLSYTAAYARISNAFLNLSEPTIAFYQARNPLMHMSEPEIMKWMNPFPYLATGALFLFLLFHLRVHRVARFVFAAFGAWVAFYPVVVIMLIMVGDFVD